MYTKKKKKHENNNEYCGRRDGSCKKNVEKNRAPKQIHVFFMMNKNNLMQLKIKRRISLT